jgi:hypothetical protein
MWEEQEKKSKGTLMWAMSGGTVFNKAAPSMLIAIGTSNSYSPRAFSLALCIVHIMKVAWN